MQYAQDRSPDWEERRSCCRSRAAWHELWRFVPLQHDRQMTEGGTVDDRRLTVPDLDDDSDVTIG
jgi:hypothetical protein